MFDSDYLTGNGNGGSNLNEKDSSSGMSEMAFPTNNVVVHDLEEQQPPKPRQPTQGPQQQQSGPLNPEVLTTASLYSVAGPPVPMSLISWTASSSDKANSSCVQLASEHETQLKNLTLVNILILVVLIIVFIANAKEGKKIIFLS